LKSVHKHISVATGKLAYPFIKKLVDIFLMKCDTITCAVYAITNDFFGHGITVSGLITGGDILNQLLDKNLGSKLLIPQNMLKFGEDVFLDDVTVSEISEKLGVEVVVVEQNGKDFFNALSENIDL
jgi:NifB/MoaA-like Fe-S oxidoreductase